MNNDTGNADPPRILLVDDTEDFTYSASRELREAGFEVHVADGYQKALEILNSPADIDLLLTDIVMPAGVNGFALARMARMRRLNLRVLYTTAYDVPAHEAIGKILRKPIAAAELIDEVKKALAAPPAI